MLGRCRESFLRKPEIDENIKNNEEQSEIYGMPGIVSFAVSLTITLICDIIMRYGNSPISFPAVDNKLSLSERNHSRLDFPLIKTSLKHQN